MKKILDNTFWTFFIVGIIALFSFGISRLIISFESPVDTQPIPVAYTPGEVFVQELNLFDGKLYRIYDADADSTCWLSVSPNSASRSISCLKGNHGTNKEISTKEQ